MSKLQHKDDDETVPVFYFDKHGNRLELELHNYCDVCKIITHRKDGECVWKILERKPIRPHICIATDGLKSATVAVCIICSKDILNEQSTTTGTVPDYGGGI